jgi:hypothetical protein
MRIHDGFQPVSGLRTSRRHFLQGTLAAGGTVAIGFPGILHARTKTLKIAALYCMSGFAQFYGSYYNEGAQLALEEMRPQLKGLQVEHAIYDTQSNPGVAVRKTHEALERGAHHIDGAILASTATALGPIASGNRVTMTTGTGQFELFGKKCNRYVFKWNAFGTQKRQVGPGHRELQLGQTVASGGPGLYQREGTADRHRRGQFLRPQSLGLHLALEQSPGAKTRRAVLDRHWCAGDH